jgi:mono/diheme cytochrome c family protein
MKRWLRIAGIAVAAVVLLLAAAVTYVATALPRIAVGELSVTTSPELVSRGDYLFNHVSACASCHSTRDTTRFAGPVVPGSEGAGGDAFDRTAGVPGIIYGRNLTPAALASWSDGELYRAISSGVDRSGRALFPLMPYSSYGHAALSDISAIIAYMRTLPANARVVPERRLSFPMSVIVNLIPKQAQPEAAAPAAGAPGYGAYLVSLASCLHCHSQDHHGAIPPGREFAGGREFTVSGGIVRSANLTPDPASGIGGWTRERFVAAFASFRAPAPAPGAVPAPAPAIAADAFNTPMPWTAYAGMTEADLGAIYDYLHALPAVANPVVKFTPAH